MTGHIFFIRVGKKSEAGREKREKKRKKKSIKAQP